MVTEAEAGPLREGKECPECRERFGAEGRFCPFDGSLLRAVTFRMPRDPMLGVVVDGRYEVLAHLGSGGMGVVYRVRHVTIDREFALKALGAEHARDPEMVERFEREARAAARARNPNIVEITDFGRLPGGEPYYVMELLRGQNLYDYARARGGRLPATEGVSIARAVGEALAAAHGVGVVHRDLKPENIFLCGKLRPTDDVRVVDFGAAKIMGGSKLTKRGVVFGTPFYMAPEQARGARVDHRADIYALGVVLYETLTGTVPFDGQSYLEIIGKHVHEPVEAPSARAPDANVPPALEAVVLRAMAKDPEDRYASMDDLIGALDDVLPSSAPFLPPPKPRADAAPLFPSMSTADRIELAVTREVTEQARARRLRRIAGVSAAAGAVLAVVVVGLTIRARPPAGTSARAPSPGASLAPRPTPSVTPASPPTAPRKEEPPSGAPSERASAPPPAPPTRSERSPRAPTPPRPRAPEPPSSSVATPPASARPAVRPDDFVDPWSAAKR